MANGWKDEDGGMGILEPVMTKSVLLPDFSGAESINSLFAQARLS